MILGEYRDLLKQAPPDFFVRFHDVLSQTGEDVKYAGPVESWRGRFRDATVTTCVLDSKITVATLLEDVEEILAGRRLEAANKLKYAMDEDATLWADPVGETTSWMILNGEVGEAAVVLHRMMLPEYTYEW